MRPKRPVLRYHGGKWRLAEWVISHFPPHSVYVEPFGGAASVLMQKEPVRIEVYNDLDDRVVDLFRILRDPDKAELLRRAIEFTPFSRTEHAMSWDPTEDEIEAARRLIIVMFQSIGNKNSRSRNGWRTRTEKAVWSPCISWNGWPKEIPAFVSRLKSTIIECKPWQEILDLYDGEGALFYVDPPYVHSTRSGGHWEVYEHEMTDDQHRELCLHLCRLRGMVVLSGYPNPIYKELLPAWQMECISARAQTNAPRTEAIWLNPAAMAALSQRPLFEVAS